LFGPMVARGSSYLAPLPGSFLASFLVVALPLPLAKLQHLTSCVQLS
jgi:hypothetical protein